MLCDTCFWRVQCLTYDNLKPGEEIYRCIDESVCIDYMEDFRLKRNNYETIKTNL